ncbi:MAG TPA: hypothetical protein VN737_06665 [Bryobacteraceae bacterium]|nr:hypothetical protein [Bryobacteraceae bacterium]
MFEGEFQIHYGNQENRSKESNQEGGKEGSAEEGDQESRKKDGNQEKEIVLAADSGIV